MISCIKSDVCGESACQFAKFDPELWGFVCKNKFVIEITKKLNEAIKRADAAERKLEKYREAVRPFIENCRKVVEIADEQKGE